MMKRVSEILDSPDATRALENNGFVDLRPDPSHPCGDDAAMVTARETFLSGGHFAPFVEAVSQAIVDAVEDHEAPIIADAGAGTGYYLAHTLDHFDCALGLGVDVSSAAASLLAHAHPRAVSVAADIREKLPFVDASVDVLNVNFALDNMAEFARVLKEDGTLVVLVAGAGHLDELREPLGIDVVDPAEVSRVQERAAEYFVQARAPQEISFTMDLDQESIANQIAMSPSAQHIQADVLANRIDRLDDRMKVSAKAVLLTYNKR